MPLIKGKSDKSFSKNVSTEMQEGKPLKQSLAIAYAMKKKAKSHHMAHGGMCEHGSHDCHMCHGGKMMADGGFVGEEKGGGYLPMTPEHEEHDYDHAVENQGFPHEEEDMISRIMGARKMSKGGMVANDTPVIADFEDNQFDDLVKDDHLEQHDTGANSGDEIGDHQEDEDRHDMVSRIMASRRKRDRLPHPM